MIIYDLACDNGHRFEGWFRSPKDFDAQLSAQLVSCPQCDSKVVRRIPSAVAIAAAHEPARPQGEGQASHALAGAHLSNNPEIQSIYRQLVKAIVANTEDVGASFAEEARKIHYQEAPERAIRGQATADEFEALKDEGIDILPLPRLKDDH